MNTVYNLLTFFDHPHCQTLLEATELASVSPLLVHRTVFVGEADILGIFLDSAL